MTIIKGTSGADILTTTEDSDTFLGLRGGDTFVFTGIFGNDIIVFDPDRYTSRILLLDDIDPADVRFLNDGTNLVIVIDGHGIITLDVHYLSVTVDLLEFADGTTIDLRGGLTFTGGNPGELLFGTAFDDVMRGNGGPDELHARGGNDTLEGGKDDDYLNGGDGIDTAVYGAAVDHRISLLTTDQQTTGEGSDWLVSIENLTGGSKSDVFTGNSQANRLDGKGGNDTLFGGGGHDTLVGGDGNDLMLGGGGNDLFSGGRGTDTVQFATSNEVDVDLRLTGAQDTGEGFDRFLSIENLKSGTGADRLIGNAVANAFWGGASSDLLDGQGGNDTLTGGSGGDDLFGGRGADVFVYRALADSTNAPAGRDTIFDFSKAENDSLDLRGIDADIDADGNQGFHFIGGAAFSGGAGELRSKTGSGGTIVTGDVDGDGEADFAIHLDDRVTLTAEDFRL